MLRKRIRRNQLTAFVVVTFGWSWGWDAIFFAFDLWDVIPVSAPRVWGPVVAAAAVVWAKDTPLRTWFERTLTWRHRPSLYLVALFVPLLTTNVQQVLRALGGGSLAYAPPAPLPLVGLFLLANVFVLGGSEEVGWRGFLQPRLQERTSVLTAGLGIGVLWWSWHLPLFFTGNSNFALEPESFLAYATFVVGASTVLGAFVNVTDGGVLPLMVMHASINVGALLEGSGGALDGSPLIALLVGSGLWWLIVVVLVLRYGKAMVPKSKRIRRAA